MEKCSATIIKKLRKKYNIPRKDLCLTIFDNKTGKRKILNEKDIFRVELREQFITLNKAKLLVESFNQYFIKHNINKKIELSDIYFKDEKTQYKYAEKILNEMENDINFNQNYHKLEKLLENCYFSTELLVNFKLGDLFYNRIEYFLSTKHYEQNLTYYIENQNYNEIDVICRRIAYYYHEINQSNKALLLYEQIKHLIDELEHKDLIKINLSICFEEIRDMKRAIKVIEELEFEEEHAKFYEFDSKICYAVCLIHLKRYDEAEEIYIKMEENKSYYEWAIGNRAELYYIKNENENLKKLYPKVVYHILEKNEEEYSETEKRTLIIRMYDLIRFSYRLNFHNDGTRCVEKLLKMLANVSFVTRDVNRIFRVFLNNAHSENILTVEKIIAHLIEHSHLYDMNELGLYISKFLVTNGYFEKAIKFYKDLENTLTNCKEE